MKLLIRNIHSFFLLLAVVSLLASCKKRDVFGDVTLNTDRVIAEFADGKFGGSIAMDYTTNDVEVDLTEVRLFIRSIVEENREVHVKFLPDPTAVADFNAANGTNYTPLPAAGYTIMSNEMVFTQSDRSDFVKIKIKPSILLGQSYAIGLKISEVTGGEPSELAGKVVVAVSVKNKYDGLYDVVGSCVDANGTYTGIYPREGVGLRTVDGSAVDYLDPEFSVGSPFFDNAYIIENASTGAPAWLFSPRFVFNTTTDKVTAILDTDGMVPFGTVSPTGPNQFTITSPDNKSFAIKYTVLSGRFTITETWTYTGPR
jgi:hypothetical protein